MLVVDTRIMGDDVCTKLNVSQLTKLSVSNTILTVKNKKTDEITHCFTERFRGLHDYLDTNNVIVADVY